MTVVRQSHELVSDKDDVTLAKAWLGPLDLASGQFNALERADSVLLVAVEAVEVAILNDGRAPVVGELV